MAKKHKWSWYFRNLNEENLNLLINFKKALQYKNVKEETIFEYQKDMKNLMEYLQEKDIKTLDATNRDIRNYLDILNVSPSRMVRIISVLNIFYKHNAKKRYCVNPMLDIDTTELREQIKNKGDDSNE